MMVIPLRDEEQIQKKKIAFVVAIEQQSIEAMKSIIVLWWKIFSSKWQTSTFAVGGIKIQSTISKFDSFHTYVELDIQATTTPH